MVLQHHGAVPRSPSGGPGDVASVTLSTERERASSDGSSPCSLASVPHKCGNVDIIRESLDGARARLAARYAKVERAWHQKRAISLARPVRDRVEGCGRPWGIAVHEDGRRLLVERRCGVLALCSRCAQLRSRRTYARMAKALGEGARRARGAWCAEGRPRGLERRWTLLTLTVPREAGDDLEARYVAIADAWHALQRWLDYATRESPGETEYVRVRETTDGTDGRGHVHYHVVALLPHLDLDALHDAWRAATGFEGVRRPDVRGSRTGDDAKGAARYIAKYVSKPSEGSEKLVGDVYFAGYGRRAYTASRGLLAPIIHEDGWTLYTVDSRSTPDAIDACVTLALLSKAASEWPLYALDAG